MNTMNISLNITTTITEFLSGFMSEGAANIGAMVTIALIYLAIFAVAGLYLVLLERKVAAWFQLRLGPNRVGYWGLLQTMADALKLVSKELTGTVKADKFLYNLAASAEAIESDIAIVSIANLRCSRVRVSLNVSWVSLIIRRPLSRRIFPAEVSTIGRTVLSKSFEPTASSKPAIIWETAD